MKQFVWLIAVSLAIISCSGQLPNGATPENQTEILSVELPAAIARQTALVEIEPPPSPLKVTDLRLESGALVWSYTNPGDYNQNGQVYVSDTTPLGIHFSHVQVDDYDQVVDGDGNGTANLADLAILGGGFSQQVVIGYTIQEVGTDQTAGQVSLADGTDPKLGRITFHYPAAGLVGTFYVAPIIVLGPPGQTPPWSNSVTIN